MGKKEKREVRLIRGDEKLEEHGVDLDAPDDELFAALTGALGVDPDADLSIADLLGSIATDGSARFLLEWEARKPEDKDLRRRIRSSLFRLHQRGIASAARAEEPGEPVRIPLGQEEPTAYLSPIDGAGNRLAWLSRHRPEGGRLLLNSLINDRTGMRRFDAHSLKATQLRDFIADVGRHSAPLASAPHRYVDWLMSEAYRKGTPRRERGGSYTLMRAELYSAPAAPVGNPVHEMIRMPDAGEARTILEGSDALFREKEFLGWALADETVRVQQARFRDAQDSTLVLTREQIAERLESIIENAFREVFDGEERGIYALRLEGMALWYRLAGRDGPALTCYVLHRALTEESGDLRGASFLRRLVARSFAHLMPEPGPDGGAGRREDDPSSLIVPP